MSNKKSKQDNTNVIKSNNHRVVKQDTPKKKINARTIAIIGLSVVAVALLALAITLTVIGLSNGFDFTPPTSSEDIWTGNY